MKKETKYKVCAYGYYKDRFSYVDEYMGLTHSSIRIEENLKEKSIPLVKYFDSMKKAKFFLKAVKKSMLRGWDKKTSIGEHKKPQWKIYKVL